MPALFQEFFDILRTMPFEAVALWSLMENVFIFVMTLIVGHYLLHRHKQYAITERPDPLTRTEVALALSTIILNAFVTIIGVILWRADIIRVRFETQLLRVILDTLILFFAMDLAMYVFHRIAHHPRLFPIVHRTHHRFENPRPLTLFVLNPFEVFGFGFLWLVVITIYPSTWLSIIIYLTLNIVFGLVGHLGVEPLPKAWVKLPFINYISTSTFHAEHHLDAEHNYGFYTLIWDRLFGTISQEYLADFTAAREGAKG